MKMQKLAGDFTVCQITGIENVDFTQEFVFLSKTDDEISLVCESNRVPVNVMAVEAGWKALKIVGTLDFGMIGVIANISRLLAEAGVSIFVVSTYNTDYILVKHNHFEKSIQLLENEGYEVK